MARFSSVNRQLDKISCVPLHVCALCRGGGGWGNGRFHENLFKACSYSVFSLQSFCYYPSFPHADTLCLANCYLTLRCQVQCHILGDAILTHSPPPLQWSPFSGLHLLHAFVSHKSDGSSALGKAPSGDWLYSRKTERSQPRPHAAWTPAVVAGWQGNPSRSPAASQSLAPRPVCGAQCAG